MAKVLSQIRPLKIPIILFVIALVLAVALLALWNVVLTLDYQRIKELAAQAAETEGGGFHVTFIALGSVLFVATIALLAVIGALLIQERRYSQRLAGFIATFTHELNSPLASIKLFAQTLRRQDAVPEPQRDRFLELILADVERLHRQLANVLRTAQVESAEGLKLKPELTDLAAYLEAYVRGRQERLDLTGRQASLELAASGDEVLVDLDESVFRQVLDNLVDNALKYGHEEGVRVTIALSVHGTRARIEVQDDGVGIATGDLERIFDRFGRAPRGRAGRQQGTGLGLWIARSAVTAHGGTIEADSPGLGRGTTITLELPLAGAAEPARDLAPL